jgi:hypothetical protein
MADKHTATPQPADAVRNATEVEGYLCAVAAATLSFIIAEMARDALTTGLNPFRQDRLTMMIIVGAMFALIAGMSALAPFLVVRSIAKRIGINAAWYFIVCGAMTGVILTPVAFMIAPASDNDVTFWEGAYTALMVAGPFFMLSGALGGLTYWWIIGRHANLPGISEEKQHPHDYR